MWKSNVRLLEKDRILYSFSYIQWLFLSSRLFEKHLGFSALKETTARFRHSFLNGTYSQCFSHSSCYPKALKKEYSVCKIAREGHLYHPSYCSLVHSSLKNSVWLNNQGTESLGRISLQLFLPRTASIFQFQLSAPLTPSVLAKFSP